MADTQGAERVPEPKFNAAVARGRVRRLLGSGPFPPPPEHIVADVLLVVTELVSNAERHGGGLTSFEATVCDGEILVDVGDRSPRPPHTTSRGSAAPGGFGWPLVRRLSRRVRVQTAGHGKVIRVALALEAPPGPGRV
ncbi:ATP-binding protein [Streptomyces sp. NPDC050560]|uniref:ATP-binding protein n=1 Tax=Streptomyces sp. NPDC050560 TaxID=3365630 RepID=UPI003799726A